jgi:hypothetical protein
VNSRLQIQTNWAEYVDNSWRNKSLTSMEDFFNKYNYSIADMKEHRDYFNYEHTQRECDKLINKRLNELMEAWLT